MTKKALIVGINQFGGDVTPLNGCVNDTVNIRTMLQNRFGFAADDIRVLTDAQATWPAIRDHMESWLLSDARAGDVRVFHFSSHGTYVADQESGDEMDGRDEVIVTHGHNWDNPVRDDMLKRIFDTTPAGVNMTVVMDCCHSGTIVKLPGEVKDARPRFIAPPFEIDQAARKLGQRREKEIAREAASELAVTLQGKPRGEWEDTVADELLRLIERKKQNRYGLVDSEEKCILLAACQDQQTAADAFIDGSYQGAFTYSLIRAIEDAGGELTYEALIKATANNLSQYTQIAQLFGPQRHRGQGIFQPLVS